MEAEVIVELIVLRAAFGDDPFLGLEQAMADFIDLVGDAGIAHHAAELLGHFRDGLQAQRSFLLRGHLHHRDGITGKRIFLFGGGGAVFNQGENRQSHGHEDFGIAEQKAEQTAAGPSLGGRGGFIVGHGSRRGLRVKGRQIP